MTAKRAIAVLLLVPVLSLYAAGAQAADWPREVRSGDATIVLYQPQVDSFEGIDAKARIAVAIKRPGRPPEFGALWVAATLDVDRDKDSAAIETLVIERARFPDASEQEVRELTALIEQTAPNWELGFSLSELRAGLEADTGPDTADFRNTPPKIIYRDRPAILVTLDGEPRLQAIAASPFQRVINTPFPIVFDPAKRADQMDLYGKFASWGFEVAKDRDAMLSHKSGKLLGIFTEHDLMTRVVVPGLNPSQVPLARIMTRDVFVATLDQPIDGVAEEMAARHIRHLPVVDHDRRFVGMISQRDILRELRVLETEQKQIRARAVPDREKKGGRGDDGMTGGNGDEYNGGQRQHGAGGGFETIEGWKAVAAQPRPAHLAVPDVAAPAFAERLLERRIDQPHPLSAGAHDLRRRRVLGRLGGERAQAAGSLDVAAAVEQGLALRKAEPDGVGGVLPARLIGVEEDAFHLRPESRRMAAHRRGRHHAGVGLPGCEQPLDVVARHQDVAVGHHDPIVGGGAPALEHVVELRVGTDALVADEEPGGDVRMLGDQAAHQTDDRVPCGCRAEQDLVAWIVERECGPQRRLHEIVEAADRADDRDRRRIVRRRKLAVGYPAADNGDGDAAEVEGDG